MPTIPTAGRSAEPQSGGDLRSLLRDLALLDPHSAHGTTVRLQASLSSTTTEATDDFDVASDFDLAVYRVSGLFAFDNLTAEPFTIASYNVSPLERAFVKAQNCKVLLEGRQDRLNILDETVFLSSILPPFGEPISYPVPHVLARGRTLRGTFTLIDTTGTNMVGAAATFGVRMDCVYVRVRASAKSERGGAAGSTT